MGFCISYNYLKSLDKKINYEVCIKAQKEWENALCRIFEKGSSKKEIIFFIFAPIDGK